MTSLFKKKKLTALDRRIERIEEELKHVDRDRRVLSKFVAKPAKPGDLSRLRASLPAAPGGDSGPSARKEVRGMETASAVSSRAPVFTQPAEGADATDSSSREMSSGRPPPRASAGGKVYEERFADYLASSLEASSPLRQERRIQRNKAILMLVFVLFLLFLVVYRLFVL